MDSCTISLPDASFTAFCGSCLPQALYELPVSILLHGELGAGKTTFTQGLAKGLGIEDAIVSPTFALEQRYKAKKELIHIDLYRLDSDDANRLLAGTDDHTGIRCIEWAERASQKVSDAALEITLKEDGPGRLLHCDFLDTELPSEEEIQRWRRELRLPAHIIDHCEAVAGFCHVLSNDLLQKGHLLRPRALLLAARLHDLFRFVDFRAKPNPAHPKIAEEDHGIWNTWKARYPGMRHELVCAEFLRGKGYSVLADIISVHGFMLPSPERSTIEQKILFYADKRVRESTVVTLEERFHDFRERYSDGKETEEQKIWWEEVRQVEQELQPSL